ncbi:MAG: 4a-hydroxytetrahydrobiopterin dehydratase [Acidimicrobiales bacterium]
MNRPALLEVEALTAWLGEHSLWQLESGHLVRELDTTDYASSVAIVGAQANLAEELDHHPIVTLGYRHLRFELWTHDRDGLSELDLRYAQGLDDLLHSQFDDVVTR